MQREVKVGQVWKDCDMRGRNAGLARHVLVVGMRTPLNSEGETFAVVRPCTSAGLELPGRETRINVKRMKPGATGYELVANAA